MSALRTSPFGLPPAPSSGEHRSAQPRNRVRRLFFHLVARLHRWAESGWAKSAIAGWAFFQGSVVPGPSDILLIPLALADPRRAFTFAGAATAGAIAGGTIAYALGALAFEEVARPLISLFGVSDARWEALRSLFERRGWMLVMLSTVSPLSTKLVCIAAGSFGVPWPHFVASLAVGRAARFFLVALVVRLAGQKLTARIERAVGRTLEQLQ